MKEEHLKKIILFYFFVTLNEEHSKELARKSWQWCQKKMAFDGKADPDTLVLLSLYDNWNKLKKENRTGVARYSPDTGWLLPKNISLEPWKAFHKEATDEELFVTVLTKVLHFRIDKIVEALGLSSGTIRYRLSKAARKIGRIISERLS